MLGLGTENRTEVVYFAQSVEGGPIKIGRSNIPSLRLAEIQHGSPTRLILLATRPGGHELETALHRRFSAARLVGEWFTPTPALLAIIEEARHG